MALSVAEGKDLICELCGLFYTQGWVSGTGGGISMKAGDKIVMAPSGVQKERMRPQDMFVLDKEGNVLEVPEARPPPYKPPKLSECSPLFMAAYELRNAGAVIHSHSLNAVMATMLDPNATEFDVTHLEMIKGIDGHGFYGHCIVPIIENTARECELTDRMRQAIIDYPKANAVLVRRHGVYIWGKDWIAAKTQAESYEYLFDAAIRMRHLGINASRAPAALMPSAAGAAAAAANGGCAKRHAEAADDAPPAAKQRKLGHRLPAAIVLDIEGTVGPISFVKDVMFPFASKHLQAHLEKHWDSAEVQQDVAAVRAQAAEDGAPHTAAPGDKAGAIAQVCAWVAGAVAQDRKVAALKTLQGHVWRQGFASGQLVAQLFRDVPDALVAWRNAGIKTYIYSSGSREAQRGFFANTTAGDMRPYLCGFFDTSSGPKQQASSYQDIYLSLGVDAPGDVLFATDVLEEAQAAAAAGWCAVLVGRPGNKALPPQHAFRVITSMEQLLQ